MKIYGSRYVNDTNLLDSLVGKDAWVRVIIGIYNPSREYMMKLFEKSEWHQLSYYKVVYFPVVYLDDEEDGRYHLLKNGFWVYEEPDDKLYADDIYVVKPIDILTTDEVFCLEDI